jgi:hypothetical protein
MTANIRCLRYPPVQLHCSQLDKDKTFVKLVIRRDQADIKGTFGGHKGVRFSLFYRLELTEYELGLVNRYKLEAYVLTYRNFQGTQVAGNTVGQVIQGVTDQLQSVEILVGNEKAIREACENFNNVLKIAATFGGEEIIAIGGE